MSQSLYTAASGLKAQQQNIDTIANNIANINTGGFKKSRMDFSDAIYTALSNPDISGKGQDGGLQLGHGAVAAATRRIYNAGALQMTGRSLDLAIDGEGFLTVENADGLALYTRDGAFESSAENGLNYLVTASGHYVLGEDGRRICSESSLDGAAIGPDGSVSVNGKYVAKLGLRRFPNPEGLEAAGCQSYMATVASGAAETASAAVKQGFLEGSNVDLASEMTDLITAQRTYALLSRAITTADQMKATANDIRR